MNFISNGLIAIAFGVAIISSIGWLTTYGRVARYKHSYQEKKKEVRKVRDRMDRLIEGAEKNRSKLEDKSSVLWQIGGLLNNVDNPLGTLRMVYEVLEKEDMAMVKDSPLAFINRQGGPAFEKKNEKEAEEVFQRIKDSLGGG